MIAPASEQLATRFDIHSTVLLAMTTSIFILGYGGYLLFWRPAHGLRSSHSLGSAVVVAFGPLFFGPLSEIYGRTHVLQITNMFYLSMCTAHFPDISQ